MSFLTLERIFRLIVTLALIGITTFAAASKDRALEAYAKGRYPDAIELWRELAEGGDREAQYSLGVMYYKGKGIARNTELAVAWFMKAADQGYTAAMFNVGVAFWNGEGAETDHAEALKWWQEAAQADYAAAQYNLGIALYLGDSIEKDQVRAIQWLRRAAGQNYAGATQVLALIDDAVAPELSDVNLQSTPDEGSSEETTPQPLPPIELETQEETSQETGLSATVAPNEPIVIEGATLEKNSNTGTQASGQSGAEQQIEQTATTVKQEPGRSEVRVSDADEFTETVRIGKTATAVYASNSRQTPLIETLEPGMPVRVVGRVGSWLNIQAPGGFPIWVHGDYVDKDETTVSSATITGDGVRARSLPSTSPSSIFIGAMDKDTEVQYLERQGDWVRVRAPEELAAWIENDNVERQMEILSSWWQAWLEARASVILLNP